MCVSLAKAYRLIAFLRMKPSTQQECNMKRRHICNYRETDVSFLLSLSFFLPSLLPPYLSQSQARYAGRATRLSAGRAHEATSPSPRPCASAICSRAIFVTRAGESPPSDRTIVRTITHHPSHHTRISLRVLSVMTTVRPLVKKCTHTHVRTYAGLFALTRFLFTSSRRW